MTWIEKAAVGCVNAAYGVKHKFRQQDFIAIIKAAHEEGCISRPERWIVYDQLKARAEKLIMAASAALNDWDYAPAIENLAEEVKATRKAVEGENDA